MKVMLNSVVPEKIHFKAIASGGSSSFSPEQRKIADNIVNELRTPKPELDNMTAENFYKHKYGLDFLMLPSFLRQDTIELYGTYFRRNIQTGDSYYKKGDTFRIGSYNTQNIGNINNSMLQDIKNSNLKEPNTIYDFKLWGYLALALFLYGSLFAIHGLKKEPLNTKALIENVDTLVKKADTIANDTINLF